MNSMNYASQSSVTSGSSVDPATINDLMTTLASKDGLARQRAREFLIEVGKPAVPALMEALTSPNQQLRWEAAKALSEIGDPRSAPALVTASEDNDPGIRWMAAEGLIKIGRPGLAPLLEALVEHSNSVRLRQGAHRVVGALAKGNLYPQLRPVLMALESTQPVVDVPQAAQNALETLT